MSTLSPPPLEDRNTFLWRLVHLEPVVLRGVIVSLLMLLASLGIIISPQLPDELIAFLAAVAALYQALWTRSAVTPNAKVVVAAPDPVNRPNVITAGEATTTAHAAAILDAAHTAPRRFL